MGLEEAFGISVEESSAQSIATVEDAANLTMTLLLQNRPKLAAVVLILALN